MKFEIISDGRTMWVNASDGCNIGRFSRRSMEIHRNFKDQIETGEECLNCTHGLSDLNTWKNFKLGMLKHYGLKIAEKHKPKFLRKD